MSWSLYWKFQDQNLLPCVLVGLKIWIRPVCPVWGQIAVLVFTVLREHFTTLIILFCQLKFLEGKSHHTGALDQGCRPYLNFCTILVTKLLTINLITWLWIVSRGFYSFLWNSTFLIKKAALVSAVHPSVVEGLLSGPVRYCLKTRQVALVVAQVTEPRVSNRQAVGWKPLASGSHSVHSGDV